ncbi:hypothetical protein NDU88_010733 [Pleurodeles waltl]|uniref:Uncharacterized protein n=1 Tax=Pleurodeles waltl TaxID=8319 RepID=A0AAV7S053_PLEWA|nr:hypothetical protein NDU88_010733 [Pleurodeles waltl]
MERRYAYLITGTPGSAPPASQLLCPSQTGGTRESRDHVVGDTAKFWGLAEVGDAVRKGTRKPTLLELRRSLVQR